MIRRVGRPGLVGLAARTAVVAGTASAVQGHAAARQQQAANAQQAAAQQAAAEQQAAIEAAAQQAAAQQAAPPAPPPAVDLTAELTKLASLHQAGVLSDEEFTAAKTRLIG